MLGGGDTQTRLDGEFWNFMHSQVVGAQKPSDFS